MLEAEPFDLRVDLTLALFELRELARSRRAPLVHQVLLCGQCRAQGARGLLARQRQEDRLERRQVLLLGLKTRLLGGQLDQLVLEDALVGDHLRGVEPRENLALLHEFAVLDENSADDAALRMLNGLRARLNHEGARRDDRTVDLGGERPPADHEAHGQRAATNQRIMRRIDLVLVMRSASNSIMIVSAVLRNGRWQRRPMGPAAGAGAASRAPDTAPEWRFPFPALWPRPHRPPPNRPSGGGA